MRRMRSLCLRARRERPRSRRPTEQRDELAALQLIEFLEQLAQTPVS
jgi:hypothetical protein